MTDLELIATARRYLDVRETSTNAGPHIDDWLRAVGCNPGVSWCAAAVCAWIAETDPKNTFHRSASALSLLERNLAIVINDPQPGDVVVWSHDPVKHLGHTGIITSTINVDGKLASIVVIAGNTSADGQSRNGDRVAEHECSLDKVAGYLRVCTQAPNLVA
jgi:hypothetical protein